MARRARFEALRPPAALAVSQWTDAERILSPESSPEPGPWRTSRAPYLRGIMDALHEDDAEIVVAMTAAQIGKTSVLENILGYSMAVAPAPVMVVLPTLEMALAFSKDRLAPMLRDTPALRGKVRDARAKDAETSNTLLHKTFPGGHLTIAGANSPASLASRPIKILLADEVDRWPLSLPREGDPLALAMRRTATFWDRKMLVCSTPTVRGGSRIEAWFEQSDQRKYHVSCPRCEVLHVLEWRNVKWEAGAPESAHLICPSCGGSIEEAERLRMLQAGVWRATAEAPSRIVGFHLSRLYSPWESLSAIAADFLSAKRGAQTLRTFVNTSLGESWEEPAEQIDPGSLLLRREGYEAELPSGVVAVTLGADVQDDRIETLAIGWGIGEEMWLVDRQTLPGDPARPEVWAMLDELLGRRWRHANGIELPIHAAALDTAGHKTQHAYDYVLPRQVRRVHATIGRTGGGHQLVSSPRPIRTAGRSGVILLHTIDTDVAKSLIFSRLRITEKGAGFVHIPLTFDEETLAQLTSERLVTRHERGVPTRRWEKTRPRNETLDCAVEALAALRLLNPPLAAWRARIADAAGHVEQPAPGTTTPPAPKRTTAPRPRRVARSAYLSGW